MFVTIQNVFNSFYLDLHENTHSQTIKFAVNTGSSERLCKVNGPVESLWCLVGPQ